MAQVPDVARVELQGDDAALVIASDGLWDVVSDQEAADIVQEVVQVRPPPETRQQRMRDTAGLQVRRALAPAHAWCYWIAGAADPGVSACVALQGRILMRKHMPASSAWSAWRSSGRRGQCSCGSDVCLERVRQLSGAADQALRGPRAWALTR